MELTIKELLQKPNLLKLNSNEFLVVRNMRLSCPLSILWTYHDEQLVINRVGSDMEEFMKPSVVIQDEHYLVLDPNDEGYSRGIILKVDSVAMDLTVEEIAPPAVSKGDFKIIRDYRSN